MFSVIIPTFNQEVALRQQLPELLMQEGVGDVVVVNMDSEDDTKELLETLELVYPNLHHTFIPHSASHRDVHQLAFMLGCRAARYPLQILTYLDEHRNSPLLSSKALERLKKVQEVSKSKSSKITIFSRPSYLWTLTTLGHRLRGKKHFYRYFTSKKSVRNAVRFQVILHDLI